MKKAVSIALCAVLLCGCSASETFETVDDEYVQSVIQQQKAVSLTLEPGAVPSRRKPGRSTCVTDMTCAWRSDRPAI